MFTKRKKRERGYSVFVEIYLFGFSPVWSIYIYILGYPVWVLGKDGIFKHGYGDQSTEFCLIYVLSGERLRYMWSRNY